MFTYTNCIVLLSSLCSFLAYTILNDTDGVLRQFYDTFFTLGMEGLTSKKSLYHNNRQKANLTSGVFRLRHHPWDMMNVPERWS